MRSTFHIVNRCLIKVSGKLVRLNGSGHQKDLERWQICLFAAVLAQLQDVQEYVSVNGSFVGLVNNDYGVFGQK